MPKTKTARQAIRAFADAYGAKFPKAVAKVVDDTEVLLAFYDYPAEHWIHLRTTNPTPHTVVYYFGSYRDEASFANNSYPAVYTDSVSKKSQTQLVKAYTLQPGLGDGICTDGSTTKERCGGRLEDSNKHCLEYTEDRVFFCGAMIIVAATTLSRGGDSGGPVYSYHAGGVLAQGIISGEESGTNGRKTVIIPLSTLTESLNVTVTTTGNNYQTCC